MLDKDRCILIIIFIIFISTCGVAILASYKVLELWVEYDPKQAATEKVKECLDSSAEDQEEICGLIILFPCWEYISQSMIEFNGKYTIDILWYNWEDEIASRGGDEVYLKITFPDGKNFRIIWYEGGLDYCENNINN